MLARLNHLLELLLLFESALLKLVPLLVNHRLPDVDLSGVLQEFILLDFLQLIQILGRGNHFVLLGLRVDVELLYQLSSHGILRLESLWLLLRQPLIIELCRASRTGSSVFHLVTLDVEQVWTR